MAFDADRRQIQLRSFANDERGQSEGLAVVLLLAITVIGIVTVITYGAGALDDTRKASEVERAEHAMQTLDSHGTLAALGEDDSQVVNMGSTDRGQYNVQEDEGWLRIRHHNYTDSSTETIYNGTLGAVVYRNDDTEIAYQAGGVWRKDEKGAARMVSPPEFRYRDATLTLPLVKVHGSDSAAGNVNARMKPTGSTQRVFPNLTDADDDSGSGAPYDETGEPYRNTIDDGSIVVTVHSEYYQAWAEFFHTRTEGQVTVNHTAQTASVELVALGTVGDFEMPAEGNAVELRGLADGHQIDNFTIVLAPDDLDSARFNNLQWSFYAEQGSRELEIHLRKSDEIDDADVECDREWVSATVYYSDTNGNTYHGWHDDQAFATECVDRDDDGVVDETRLVANLTGDAQLTMTDLGNEKTTYFNPSGASRETSVTFDEHQTVDWEPHTFSDGDDADARIGALTNHYIGLMSSNIDLTVEDKNSDTIHERASYGRLEYTGEGAVVYLYVSENHVDVSFD